MTCEKWAAFHPSNLIKKKKNYCEVYRWLSKLDLRRRCSLSYPRRAVESGYELYYPL